MRAGAHVIRLLLLGALALGCETLLGADFDVHSAAGSGGNGGSAGELPEAGAAGTAGDGGSSGEPGGTGGMAGAGGDSDVPRYSIGGEILGLVGTLELRLNGGPARTLSPGQFRFPESLTNGVHYQVELVGGPDGPLAQACQVAGAAGVVHGHDVTDVLVTCLNDEARLKSLVVPEAPLSPAFSAQNFSYSVDVDFFVLAVGVEAAALDPSASVRVNGEIILPEDTSPPIGLERLGPNAPLSVEVEAPSGRVRTYNIEPRRGMALFDQRYVKAGNTHRQSEFGRSLALSGKMLAVGAPGEASAARGIDGDTADRSAEESGAVYVFDQDTPSWSQHAYLKASNTGFKDGFGTSVAFSGNTLAVGAPGEDSAARDINQDQEQEDDSARDSGAVYVFVREGDAWRQQAYIKASNTGTDDQFGASVALSGETLVVGAIGEASDGSGVSGDQNSDAAAGRGAVYVFQRSGETWQQQGYLKPFDDPGIVREFGVSLALVGDQLVVGADMVEGERSLYDGAAYAFTRANGQWSTGQRLALANDEQTGDSFGFRVALTPTELFVGAPCFDLSCDDPGSTYVYQRVGNTFVNPVKLVAPTLESNDGFGSSIAVAADIVVVGAPAEAGDGRNLDGNPWRNNATASGALFLFRRQGSAFVYEAYIKASNTGAFNFFGSSVAVSDLWVITGAPGENSASIGIDGDQENRLATGSGAVYTRHYRDFEAQR